MFVYDAPTNVVATGVTVFMRSSNDGNLHQYEGNGTWRKVSDPARHYVVAGSDLYKLPRNGTTIERYTGSGTFWELMGAGGGQILPCQQRLCATHDVSGELWRYTLESNSWEWISWAMRSWSSSDSSLYAVSDDESVVYRYDAPAWNPLSAP